MMSLWIHGITNSRIIKAATAVLDKIDKDQPSKKAKLSMFKAIFVSTQTYRHEPWEMTETV